MNRSTQGTRRDPAATSVLTARALTARALVGALVGAFAVVSCGPPKDAGVVRLWTEQFEIRVTPDQIPPRALERINYSIVVRDKETKEPIANGEGRIFATNADGKTSWDGFRYGPEVGTYHATITYVTAGEWALGLQFRRDSTQVLERTLDWRQMVLNEVAPVSDLPAPLPDSVMGGDTAVVPDSGR